VIEDPEEKHIIELAFDLVDLVHGSLLKFDIQFERLGGKTGLVKIPFVDVNAQYSSGTPLFKLNAIKTTITADVENGSSPKILWKSFGNVLPFHVREVTQKVIGRRPYSANVYIVKPVAERADAFCQSWIFGRISVLLVFVRFSLGVNVDE
jgi:hypothetical protein